MEFVGWYTNGDAPTAADAHFHEQVNVCYILWCKIGQYMYVYSVAIVGTANTAKAVSATANCSHL